MPYKQLLYQQLEDIDMGTSKDSEKTRAKLIEAAGQLFFGKGFQWGLQSGISLKKPILI